MGSKLNQLLGTLEQGQGLSDLQDVILQMRDHFGVSHIVYHWVSADGEQYGCGTYPPAWVQHYIDQDYLRVDPVVIGCFHRFHPVDWKALDWSSRAARAFRQEALAAGVGQQGYSIPIRGPAGQFALFSVSSDDSEEAWNRFTDARRRDLILIAHAFNQKALEMESGRAPSVPRPLSGRETDVLTYLAMGYSRGQIAEMLTLSEHTLRAYIESARFKLDAANTTQAVARAVAEGLIVVGGSARAARGNWPGRDAMEAAQ